MEKIAISLGILEDVVAFGKLLREIYPELLQIIMQTGEKGLGESGVAAGKGEQILKAFGKHLKEIGFVEESRNIMKTSGLDGVKEAIKSHLKNFISTLSVKASNDIISMVKYADILDAIGCYDEADRLDRKMIRRACTGIDIRIEKTAGIPNIAELRFLIGRLVNNGLELSKLEKLFSAALRGESLPMECADMVGHIEKFLEKEPAMEKFIQKYVPKMFEWVKKGVIKDSSPFDAMSHYSDLW